MDGDTAIIRVGDGPHFLAHGVGSPAQVCALRTQRLLEHDGVPHSAMRALVLAAYRHAQNNPTAQGYGKPLDEQTELQILNTLIKQRRESADMFRKGDRLELAEREEAELKLIESYMPAAPSDAAPELAVASLGVA